MMISSACGFAMISLLIVQNGVIAQAEKIELDYTCLLNDTVQIKTNNLKTHFQSYAVGDYNNSGTIFAQTGDCVKNISRISNNTITLKCNLAKPITVYLMNETNLHVFGGRNFHEYNLNCTFPKEGIHQKVSNNLSIDGIPSPTIEVKTFAPLPVSMIFTPSSAKIGDALNVSITGANIDQYYILPHNCTAASGSVNGKKIDLLQNGITLDEEVLTNFTVTTKGEARAILYAFRFIDSETVNFECIVTFCKTKNCVNGAYDATPAPAGKRRRRAAVEIGHGEKYQVSASFRVVDPEEVQPTSSQSVVRFHPTLTTFLVFLGTVAARRFNRECLF